MIIDKQEKESQKIKKSCGDCGKFVPKKQWVPEKNWKGESQHPLCRECLSSYDGPEYH